jgi:BirA family biotin operon repressor/biotin-[acetyl-CoA-carboxylase] ligase
LCLVFDQDALIPAWIAREAACIAWEACEVKGFLRVGSTNDEALRMARQGAPAGTVVFAEQQTAGRGRLGRRWASPPKSGLYFSVIVRPGRPTEHWPLLTHAAAVALALALQKLAEPIGLRCRADIKWPNDVLLSGKKVAGILLEAATSAGVAPAAVVGVGVNVRPESVPSGLESTATAVDREANSPLPRRQLLVQFLTSFQTLLLLFERGEDSAILEQWKGISTMWNGVPVRVVEGSKVRSAVTQGLSDLGALRIRTENGDVETILAGDVSVRLAK